MSQNERDAGENSEAAGPGLLAQRFAIKRAVAAFRQTVKATPKEKLYWYRSPKASTLIEVRGDTMFAAVVLSEIDPNVVRFEIEAPTQVASVAGEPTGTRFDIRRFLRDGTQ